MQLLIPRRSHWMRLLIAFVFAFGLAGTVTGCDRGGTAAAHENLTSLAQLRRAFNADSGKVRAIFLASPT